MSDGAILPVPRRIRSDIKISARCSQTRIFAPPRCVAIPGNSWRSLPGLVALPDTRKTTATDFDVTMVDDKTLSGPASAPHAVATGCGAGHGRERIQRVVAPAGHGCLLLPHSSAFLWNGMFLWSCSAISCAGKNRVLNSYQTGS